MMARTPGPWSVNADARYESGKPCYVWGPEGPGHGAVCELSPHYPREFNADDAALIAAAPDLLRSLSAATWLVWSNEHGAWWGPNRSHYYTDINSAGRYTLEDALAICKLRSRVADNPEEMIQPSPEWLEARAAAIAKATRP